MNVAEWVPSKPFGIQHCALSLTTHPSHLIIDEVLRGLGLDDIHVVAGALFEVVPPVAGEGGVRAVVEHARAVPLAGPERARVRVEARVLHRVQLVGLPLVRALRSWARGVGQLDLEGRYGDRWGHEWFEAS